LAADFDDMTARLETLIGSQQRLMRDVSHELRSPLARIRVALELARLGQPDSTALHQIERDADRMDALIGEILVLARLESRERRLPHEPVALGLLIDEIALDARLEAEPRHVGIDTRGTTENSLTVTGDRELLRRAIENLVRNALRHSPAGTRVSIAAERRDARVRVIVGDQGPGLPEEIQRHLFEPFRRGSGEHGEGSGLGLAIAQRAIVLHGGTLEVSSSTAGTRVTIDLPLDVARADQA
jgi:signal transduction histidine kinase